LAFPFVDWAFLLLFISKENPPLPLGRSKLVDFSHSPISISFL